MTRSVQTGLQSSSSRTTMTRAWSSTDAWRASTSSSSAGTADSSSQRNDFAVGPFHRLVRASALMRYMVGNLDAIGWMNEAIRRQPDAGADERSMRPGSGAPGALEPRNSADPADTGDAKRVADTRDRFEACGRRVPRPAAGGVRPRSCANRVRPRRDAPAALPRRRAGASGRELPGRHAAVLSREHDQEGIRNHRPAADNGCALPGASRAVRMASGLPLERSGTRTVLRRVGPFRGGSSVSGVGV